MNKITSYRNDRDLTQADLALQLATTKATVSRWEAGTRRPSISKTLEIERLTGIDRCDLRPDLFTAPSINAKDGNT